MLRVFISYPGKDGLALAKQADKILQDLGNRTYLFARHKTVGTLVFEDIENRITQHSDVFLHLCTPWSLVSRGQRLEVGYALPNSKLTISCIPIDGAQPPGVLKPFVHDSIDSNKFKRNFKIFCENLPKAVANNKRLEDEITAKLSSLSQDINNE